MFCSNCGKEINGQGNYCEFCGTHKNGGSSDKPVEQGPANIGYYNYLPQNNLIQGMFSKVGNAWQSVLAAIFGALFVCFPVTGSTTAFSYFEKAKNTKYYFSDYWYKDLDLWIALLVILDLASIFFCYKMVMCLIDERIRSYTVSYSKKVSICAFSATVVAFIYSIRTDKMYDDIGLGNTCSCTIWVWIIAIISLANLLVLSKKVSNSNSTSGVYSNTLAQMAYDSNRKNVNVNNSWVCKKCGFVNPNYTGTCSCGNPKYNN